MNQLVRDTLRAFLFKGEKKVLLEWAFGLIKDDLQDEKGIQVARRMWRCTMYFQVKSGWDCLPIPTGPIITMVG